MIFHDTRRDLKKFCMCSNAKYLGRVENVFHPIPKHLSCAKCSVLTCMLPEPCPSVHLRTQPGNQATVPLFRTLQTLVYGVPGGTLSPSPTVMSWGIESVFLGKKSKFRPIKREKDSFLASDGLKFGTERNYMALQKNRFEYMCQRFNKIHDLSVLPFVSELCRYAVGDEISLEPFHQLALLGSPDPPLPHVPTT